MSNHDICVKCGAEDEAVKIQRCDRCGALAPTEGCFGVLQYSDSLLAREGEPANLALCEHAYDGRNDCQIAEDVERESYFQSYLEETKP